MIILTMCYFSSALLGQESNDKKPNYNAQKYFLTSTPLYSQIISNNSFEFSYPDLSTFSHLRISIGEIDNFQFHIGLGLITADLGFSKQWFLYQKKYSLLSQTLLGTTVLGTQTAEQKFCIGYISHPELETENLISFGLGVGYYSKAIQIGSDIGFGYLTTEIGFSHRFRKIEFSFRGGIQIVRFESNYSMISNNLGFGSRYLF